MLAVTQTAVHSKWKAIWGKKYAVLYSLLKREGSMSISNEKLSRGNINLSCRYQALANRKSIFPPLIKHVKLQ